MTMTFTLIHTNTVRDAFEIRDEGFGSKLDHYILILQGTGVMELNQIVNDLVQLRRQFLAEVADASAITVLLLALRAKVAQGIEDAPLQQRVTLRRLQQTIAAAMRA